MICGYRYSLTVIILLCLFHHGLAINCCNNVPRRLKHSKCRDACDKLKWVANGPLQQIETFPHIHRNCPSSDQLPEFWGCIRDNYPVLEEIEIWEGRVCCELAFHPDCQVSCQQARSLTELQESCPRDTEAALHTCVTRQTGSSVCCRNAYSTDCKSACRSVFVSDRNSDEIQENLHTMCSGSDKLIPQCVTNWTMPANSPAPSENLHCCERGANSACRQTCINALTSQQASEEDIIQMLITDCNEPVSVDPLWQCFLLSSEATANRAHLSQQIIESMPMDGASIQCCAKAVSSQCRSLCEQMYTRQWASVWENFSLRCQYNPRESEMNRCILGVEEPCQVGCSGLLFCSNFNYRSNEMYRMCNKEADQVARAEYGTWLEDRVIRLPTMTVPIHDISKCEPEMWKAISCALQIKPCNEDNHSNKICKSDCVAILTKCVDTSRMSYDVSAICDMLPVSSNQRECISLKEYTYPVENSNFMISTDLRNPCIPNPCNSSQTCQVNTQFPHCQSTHPSCEPYVCRTACSLGDSSKTKIKVNYYAKMADINSSSPLRCQKICKCGHRGKLTHCSESDCVRPDSCITAQTGIEEHGTRFFQDCNECVCHSGISICSKRSCRTASTKASLPCDCHSEYDPVCTTNGRVFGNGCLASCAGFSEHSYERGNCASRNPCGANPCNAGYKCIPHRRVCLTFQHDCPQYQCVPAYCNPSKHGPVCDNSGVQHSNLCSLLRTARGSSQLGYRGHCQHGCEHTTSVCGVNGETYMTECAALADHMAVDYHDSCHTHPNAISDTVFSEVCDQVHCQRMIPDWCESFIPPGACCPVCGSQIRVLYSDDLVDSIISKSDIGTVTVKDIAEHLGHLLSNAYCRIHAYLSIEAELVLLVLPVKASPSRREVEICELDAKRLHLLLEEQSPLLHSDVILSVLLRAKLHSSHIRTMEANSAVDISSSCWKLLTLLAVHVIVR